MLRTSRWTRPLVMSPGEIKSPLKSINPTVRLSSFDWSFSPFVARGLDIPSIRTVVNYDVARDIDTHTHRIGRTGRAGEKGVAYTLLTNKDTSFAGDLVRNLEGANQSVSKELMDLAMQVNRIN